MKFVKSSDSKLDCQVGTVIGKLGSYRDSHPYGDYFIIKTDSEIEGYDPVVVMTEHCLERI